jgi:site-specific recombinase XerD
LCGVDRHLKHYATRHTLATYILNNGGNINQVMKVLGVSMNTAMTYAKLVPGSELQILNKIGEKKQKLPLVQVK